MYILCLEPQGYYASREELRISFSLREKISRTINVTGYRSKEIVVV